MKNGTNGLGFDQRMKLIAAKRHNPNVLLENTDLCTALTDETPFTDHCYELISDHLEEIERRKFLPISAMESIFGPSNVRTIILETFPNFCDKSRDKIHLDISGSKEGQTRTRIFATLVRIGKPEHILRFINADIFDNDLPLDREAFMIKEFNAPASSYSEPSKWGLFDEDNFLYNQQVLLAPFLYLNCQTIQHYTFGYNTTMPFLEKKPAGRGGHGQIFRVKIHADHYFCESHEKWELSGPYYALKKFEAGGYQQFVYERKALLHFSGGRTGHEHLTRLLMTYQIEIDTRNEYYMIFPWAECNLEEWWTDNTNNPADYEQQRWLLKQCLGLASGLRTVHKHPSLPKKSKNKGNGVQDRGRHGDLKPQNILCFKVQGQSGISQYRLVIADFTLMRFHSVHSIDRPEGYTVGRSRTYRPPEVDLGKGAKISQSYDVWTLGCVYLEFITWHLLGKDSLHDSFELGGILTQGFQFLREMEDSRRAHHPEDKYFNIEEEGDRRRAVVKPCVTKDHMLVVETEQNKRYTIDMVCTELHEILKMPVVEDDPSFASCPKSPDGVKDFPPPYDSEVERESKDRAKISDRELSARADEESGSDDKVFGQAFIGLLSEKKPHSSKSANKTSKDYLNPRGGEMSPITSSARSSPRRRRAGVNDHKISSDLLNGSTQSSDFTRPITPTSDISLVHGGGPLKRKREDKEESGDNAVQSNATKKRNMGDQSRRRSMRLRQKLRNS